MKTAKNLQLLIKQAQVGDSESFGKVYDLLLDKVYRFIYFRVGKKEEAEDLTETVFLKAWQGLKNYQDDGVPFEAWIFRIARNLVIDYYRTKKQLISIEGIKETKSNDLTPEEQTELKLTYESVLRGLEKLPDSYKEIIVLKFIEEKTNDEISTILQKPVTHIRVLQNRALKKLRKLLEND